MKNYKTLFVSMLLTISACFYGCDELTDDEAKDNSENTTEETQDKSDEKVQSEIQTAVDYINKVRKNPASFSQEIGADLSYVETRAALNWDSKLAKAAQAKAEDMANNNYFSHTDLKGCGMNIKIYEAGYELESSWYSDPSANYFENIAAGTKGGIETVKMLILDKNSSTTGHRNSLLGIGDFYSDNTDIGIGYAYNPNSTYKYYWSILVARHKW
jgi:uncharacterized protein YkwD